MTTEEFHKRLDDAQPAYRMRWQSMDEPHTVAPFDPATDYGMGTTKQIDGRMYELFRWKSATDPKLNP